MAGVIGYEETLTGVADPTERKLGPGWLIANIQQGGRLARYVSRRFSSREAQGAQESLFDRFARPIGAH